MHKAKHITLLSIIVAFLLALGACSPKNFVVKIGSFNGVPIENDIALLKTCDEVENYLTGERFLESSDFKSELLEYGDDYFQEKNLIVVNLQESSSSNKLTIESVEISDAEIIVTIKRKIPNSGTASLKTWCFIIEIDYTDIIEVRYIVKE